MVDRTHPGPALFEAQAATYRFLLVISPAPELSALVKRLKVAQSEQIGAFSGLHSIPHITLFFADLPLECERDICEGVAAGVVGHKAFTLHYAGIAHFSDKRTIYIDPIEKDSIAQMRNSIVAQVRSYPKLSDAIRETDHPHLTIAAGLKPAQFERAWESLAPHQWRGEEQVTELVMLRRELRPGVQYEHVRSFPLE